MGSVSAATRSLLTPLLDLFGVELRLKRNLEQARRDAKRRERDQKWRFLAGQGFDVVVDIGANVGQFARLARAFCPTARILSFEPLPGCAKQLEAVAAELGNMQVFPYALGAESGFATFHANEFSPSSSLLQLDVAHVEAFPFAAKTSECRVEVRRLDEFSELLAGTPNFVVKIDVQGGEWGVIEGGAKLLSVATAIVVEMSFAPLYEGQRMFGEVYSRLRRLGFEFRGAVDQLASPRDGQILQIDGLFVRAGAPHEGKWRRS
jgi:FkbM family methyltransferase